MHTRTHQTYDPQTDLRDRFPEWRVRPTRLYGPDELFVMDEHLVLVEEKWILDDWEAKLTHVIAHLDLHLDQLTSVGLSEHDERAADQLAAFWLDRETSRIPG